MSVQRVKFCNPLLENLVNGIIIPKKGVYEFKKISDTYEDETDEVIKTLMTMLEPILILAIGSVVALIVFAMLLPIFQIDLLSQ